MKKIKTFEETLKKIESLKSQENKLHESIFSLCDRLRTDEITADFSVFLVGICLVTDKFLDDVCIMCQGIDEGYLVRTDVFDDIINGILKCKYDKKDNMIIDIHNAISKGYDKIGLKLPPTRISRYERIFKRYKKNLPLLTRLRGLFDPSCMKVK